MTFIPIPDGAQIISIYGDGNQQWTNTLYATKPDFTDADMLILADAVHTQFGTGIAPEIQNAWSLLAVKVYDMRTETGIIVFDSLVPVAGGKVGDKSPISVAACVTLYTAARGKSARGRNYVTGFIEADTGSERITNPVVLTNVQQAYTNLIGVLAVLGWTLSVVQRVEEGTPLLEAVAREIISALIRSDLFTHQRRRVPRP